MNEANKEHWEKVYQTKTADEVSWTQEVPQTSLDFIHSYQLPKTACIIDIGGGDSKLVDCLLSEGYENITVLDISAAAIDRAKTRLGERSAKVTWVVSDILDYKPTKHFDIWHDRATFHFLTQSDQVSRYLATAKKAVKGHMIIGTFSDHGPTKCSGLSIKQYTEESLEAQFSDGLKKTKCITEDHTTPFNTHQNFLFCSFKRES